MRLAPGETNLAAAERALTTVSFQVGPGMARAAAKWWAHR
jgi:hypothetical protein